MCKEHCYERNWWTWCLELRSINPQLTQLNWVTIIDSPILWLIMPKSICARAMVVESYCSYAQCWDWPSIDSFEHSNGTTYPSNIAQYCVSFSMFSLVFLPKCKLGLYKVKSMLEEHISIDMGNCQEVSSILSLQLDCNGNSKLCSIYFLVLLWFQVACVGLLLHGIFMVFANGLHLNKSNTNVDEHVWLIVHSHAGPTPPEHTFP